MNKLRLLIDQNIFRFAMILILFASITSLAFYYSQGLNFAYNDATSHLNISRRIIDSLTPGLVQIGSTWLPLLHILELFTIWNRFMWQSGLSGAIVSMSSFVLTGYFIFKGVELLTKDRLSALIGIIILIANANMLYMQTTAMFEPLLIVTLSGSFYFLLRWTKLKKISSLIFASFFVMLGTLSRYDAWPVLIVSTALVFIYSLLTEGFKKAKAYTILFVTAGSFGIILWFIYNLAIFGNPFYFAFNEFSAFTQQATIASQGHLPTKGNFMLALITYIFSSILNQGIVLSIFAIIGIAVFTLRNVFEKSTWPVFILLVPFVFNVSALFKGHSVIWIPNLPPYFETFFNVRYGLLLMPAVAIFVSYLTKKNSIMKIVVLIAIITQVILFYSFLPNRKNHLSFATLRDTVASINKPTLEATQWLSQNYDSGLILISSASSESFIFNTGLNIKNYITEGTGHYWKESLEDPTKYATWVVIFPAQGDRVGKALKNNSIFKKNYEIVFQNQTYLILKRRTKFSIDSLPKSSSKTWKIQIIDTMKTSRDQARHDLTDKEAPDRISRELQAIKNTGANYVAVDTPYDEEFLPILKLWVTKAHKLGLHVWFRGNFSSWEGWFDYPKNMDTGQHLEMTSDFIRTNQNLFVDGDSFTGAPEAENGGPWGPVGKNDTKYYREFLKDQYDLCKASFAREEKQIYCNWFSMNKDIVNNILDKETVKYVGNQITIDHYVVSKEQMGTDIQKLHDEFGALILIGEFGAPIPDINGSMNDEKQAEFVRDVYDVLSNKDYIIGVSYWTSKGGTTALFDWDLSPKIISQVITDFYSPATLEGVVTNEHKKIIKKAKIVYNNKIVYIDNQGRFSISLPAGKQYLELVVPGNKKSSFSVVMRSGEITKYDLVINAVSDNKIAEPEEFYILVRIQNLINSLRRLI